MGRLYDATQAAIERKNAVVTVPEGEEPPGYSDDIVRAIFYDFDIDFEELDVFVRQGIDFAIERVGVINPPDELINAVGDSLVNGLLVGLYHERMRASESDD